MNDRCHSLLRLDHLPSSPSGFDRRGSIDFLKTSLKTTSQHSLSHFKFGLWQFSATNFALFGERHCALSWVRGGNWRPPRIYYRVYLCLHRLRSKKALYQLKTARVSVNSMYYIHKHFLFRFTQIFGEKKCNTEIQKLITDIFWKIYDRSH